MHNPFLSIIVPVYNVEQYLHKCLESIVSQTYKNIEIVLVDDGSKDASGQICDEYAERDNRIIVFHQDNKGPGAARNLGIKHARGEFITFVDSDDWISKEYAEIIFKEMKTDLLFWGMRAIKRDGKIYDYILPQIEKESSIEEQIYSMVLRMNSYYDFIMTANKCFSKSIINKYNLEFPTDIIHSEDEIFTLKYLLHIHSFKCINNILYYYNQRDNSASIHITTKELFRICNYQYIISDNFTSRNIRAYIKIRWLFFNYRNFCYNYNNSKDIIKNLKGNLTNDDVKSIKYLYQTQRNNLNIFPNSSFILFVEDILILSNYSLMSIYSVPFIRLRRKWFYLKRVLSKNIQVKAVL